MPTSRSHNLKSAAVMACVCVCLSLTPATHAQPGDYRIAGRVVSSVSGAPLSQTRVTITNVKGGSVTQSVITGDSGAFVFANLPAGKYSLSAARRGFIESMFQQHEQYSTAIATGGEADSEHLVFRLTPQAILSGRVLDESGDPVRRANFTLYRQTQRTGMSRIGRAGRARTDDRGSYEFADLPPGDYFLAVNARPWYALHPPSVHTGGGTTGRMNPDGTMTTTREEETITTPVVAHSFDVTYATTYYPDATDSDEATPIPLRGGERLTADVHLSPVPALRILVRRDRQGGAMPQFLKKSFDVTENLTTQMMARDGNASDNPRPSNFTMLGNGLMEFTGIPAGKYTVRVPPIPGAGFAGSIAEFEINQNGQEINPSAGEPVSSAKFSVRVMSAARPPQGLMLALQTQEHKVIRTAPVDAQGTCEMLDIPPGRYNLLAGTGANDYAVTHISINGSQGSGSSLEIVADSTIEAAVTVVGGQTTVQGIAKRGGKGLAGAMIVLVPKNPEAQRELFRRDQSDLDGTFSLASVIPGEYTIVAIENGWDLNWSQPGVIAHYLPSGRQVMVGTSQQTIRLSEAVEVQPR